MHLIEKEGQRGYILQAQCTKDKDSIISLDPQKVHAETEVVV